MALAAACTAGMAVASGMPACITAPPPEVPQLPPEGPTILHNSVMPPTNQNLVALPPDGSFSVPIVLGRPTPFEWEVYVDFDPKDVNTKQRPTTSETPGAMDGGIYDLTFLLGPTELGDPNACHRILFAVAANFKSPYSPDALGSDSVMWWYVPNGPNGCIELDAGALQDGAFPPVDAPTDAPLLTPEGAR